MPTNSPFPDIQIPEVDLWGLMFEQPRDFPDTQGRSYNLHQYMKLTVQSYIDLLMALVNTLGQMSKMPLQDSEAVSVIFGTGRRVMS